MLRPDDEWMLMHRFRRRCYADMDRAISPLEAMFLRELSGLGITRRTAFPDLDGVARSLWETQVLWTP